MTKRRGSGEGGIRQRPDGRWEATVNLGWTEDGKRQRRFFYGRTKAEVVKKLRAAHQLADRGLPMGDCRTTVGQYLERWLEVQQRSGKAVNTTAQYTWAVNVHLVPALGRIRLAQLTPEDVEDFLAGRAASGMARNSLMRLRSVLSMVLTQAARRDIVARNVAALTELPAAPTRVKKALTQQQAAVLLGTAAGDRLEAAYLMMLLIGCRPGEALGLTWNNVDFEAGTVRIVQALKVEGGSRIALGSLKTSGSRRTVAMPALLAAGLRRHRRGQLGERMKAGPVWSESGLVFTTQIGTPIHPRNFRRSFDRLVAKAGLGDWTPNELRHSAVSLLSAAGMRAEDIADLVGHTTTRMTTQVYRHQVTPTITSAKETTDRIFGGGRDDRGGQFGGQTADPAR